jgi:beta-glucuronidase
VWLYATDPAHISDVMITTDLDGDTGVINYTADAEAADDLETKVILRDAEGTEVATDTGPSGTLHVPNVHKWAPGEGYVYDLEFRWYAGTPSLTATTKASAYAPFRWTGFGS